MVGEVRCDSGADPQRYVLVPAWPLLSPNTHDRRVIAPHPSWSAGRSPARAAARSLECRTGKGLSPMRIRTITMLAAFILCAASPAAANAAVANPAPVKASTVKASTVKTAVPG